MPVFTHTLTYRGADVPKAYLENVAHQLRIIGARIIDTQIKIGQVGSPPTPISIVTITYEASSEIRLISKQP